MSYLYYETSLISCCAGLNISIVSLFNNIHMPYTPRAVPKGILRRLKKQRTKINIRAQYFLFKSPIPPTKPGMDIIINTVPKVSPIIDVIRIATSLPLIFPAIGITQLKTIPPTHKRQLKDIKSIPRIVTCLFISRPFCFFPQCLHMVASS